MKFSSFAVGSVWIAVASTSSCFTSVMAFCPATRVVYPHNSGSTVLKMGYLEDLGAKGPEPEVEVDDSREATKMAAENIDRAGPGSWDQYVEFEEFDGGDGQMGVAGDGNKKLESFDMSEMAKSRTMSAKNAFGRTTGYADTLREQGVDTARAQQLENWHNQQEVLNQRKNQRYMTEEFDQVTNEEDNWRNLAKFGVERNQVSVGFIYSNSQGEDRMEYIVTKTQSIYSSFSRTLILMKRLVLLPLLEILKEPLSLLVV
jgi:hypothetical protein